MTPAQEAALRLYTQAAAQGKVRTHTHDDGPRRGDNCRGLTEAERRALAATKRKHIRTGKGRGGGNARKVIVGSRTFPTVRAARDALKVSTITLYDMLNDGRARYA